jgi:uncharacterized protein involved in exopolysaccharide biosynthesis
MTTELDTDPELRVPSLRDLLLPVFRHKRAGILTMLAVLTGTITAVLSTPKQYEAEMQILVKRERMDPVMSSDPNAPPQGRAEVTEEELNSEVELLKSRDLLEQVVVASELHSPGNSAGNGAVVGPSDRPALSRAVRSLEKGLKIAPLRKTTLIKVTYRSPDPIRAARVLDELARLYLEKHLAVHRPPGAHQFFSAQAERFREELAAAESRLKEFGRQQRVVSPDLEMASTLQKLAEFEAALQQSQQQIVEAARRMTDLEAQAAETPVRQTTQIRTSDNVELMTELKSKILTLEIKRSEMLSKFTPSYPPVVQLEEELAQARAALGRTEQSPLTEETSDRNPTHQWLRSELARVRTERVGAVARAAAIAASVRAYREKARQLDEKGAEHEDLKRALKSTEENYLLYRRKQEEARISDALDRTRIANVALAEAPTVPSLPSSSARSLLLFGGAVIALVLGLAVTYLLDYITPYFHTPADVERALAVPVLASIPADR